jgi:hypothetical protein
MCWRNWFLTAPHRRPRGRVRRRLQGHPGNELAMTSASAPQAPTRALQSLFCASLINESMVGSRFASDTLVELLPLLQSEPRRSTSICSLVCLFGSCFALRRRGDKLFRCMAEVRFGFRRCSSCLQVGSPRPATQQRCIYLALPREPDGVGNR